MSPAAQLLTGYSVIIEFPIAWGDMDAFQHVNNVQYFRYFESARIAYFQKLNALEFMQASHIGPILKDAYTKFRFPLTYPDTISVGIRIVDLQADRFKMEYKIISQQHRVVAAEGYGWVVYYDYAQNAKANIPEKLVRLIQTLEGK